MDWLFIPYLSSVAHQFLPNQGESKRIRQSFLVLIKENHTIILLYKFCFLKRELSFLGLIYPVFICSIRISLELLPPVVLKSNIQGPKENRKARKAGVAGTVRSSKGLRKYIL